MADLPSDLQALIDRVVEGAARSCGADDAIIQLLEDDHLRRLAHVGPLQPPAVAALTLDRDANFSSKAMLDHAVVQIEDAQAIKSGTAGQRSKARGARTVMWAPLLVDERVIGVISLARIEVRPFTDAEMGLVQDYADMAALAIENARLKAESEQRNAALAEALEHQTATAEVLSIINSSTTEALPVF